MSTKQIQLTSAQQIMFEQRLCDNKGGLALRIIDKRSGKSHLNNIQCVMYKSLPTRVHKNVSRTKWLPHRWLPFARRKSMNNVLHMDDSMIVRTSSSMKSDAPLLLHSSDSISFDDSQERPIMSGSHVAVGVEKDDRKAVATSNDLTIALHLEQQLFQSRNSDLSTIVTHYEDTDVSNPWVLVWRKGRKIQGIIALQDIISIKKGKATTATDLSRSPSSHLLSIIASPSSYATNMETIDIEAPTLVDRDKFALAFAS